MLTPQPRAKLQWDDLLQIHQSGQAHSDTSKANNKKHPTSCHKAALRLFRCGELSRAAKLLFSPGLAPTSEDVAEKLARKHPQRDYDIVRDQYADSFNPIELSRSSFLIAVNSLPRGSGTGPSGWWYEHLKILAECESTEEGLFCICSMIAKGRIPSGASTLLSASRLIAIPKSNGDVRPIAIGESLRLLTAKTICIQKKNSFAQFFSPLQQHGVAVQGGSKLLVHHSCYWTRILTG